MDKFVIRVDDPADLPCDHKPLVSSALKKPSTPRSSKKRLLLSSYEIYGRLLPAYKRSLLKLMLRSYSELGSFLQSFPMSELSRHAIHFDVAMMRNAGSDPFGRYDTPAPGSRFMNYTKRPYVSCIDFDSKGIYLASVNNTGCLSVHEYETLYCSAASGSNEESARFIRYISTDKVLEAVRWNPFNPDEVACVASGCNKVYFYDIACDSILPSEVLRVKSNGVANGLNDLLICKQGSSRVLACGKDGTVHIWDRRASKLSYAALPVTSVAGPLNCMQLSNDEKVVYAGSEGGLIHGWDLRGGKRAAAFVTCGEVYHPPFGAVKLSTVMSNVYSLRAQTEVGTSAVHSISLDSSSGHRLAFHLNNGWSGVLDLATLEVTHLHCPPPPWLDGMLDDTASLDSLAEISANWATCVPAIRRRRPVWIPSHSVYAVPSASASKVHILDFTPGPLSRYSVDHDGSVTDQRDEQSQVEVPTSDSVVAIAAHPLNDQLVAGTQGGKVLLLGQKKSSSSNDNIK
ncbi:unnamed protein product [Calypogeia fissa]